MIKCDYYKFFPFEPYVFDGEKHRTLREAKDAVYKHVAKGHRGNWSILGCTLKDDCIFLTFTPWLSDVKSFGKTILTNMGEYYQKHKL